MWELERHRQPSSARALALRVAIVGGGRLGGALATALRRSGAEVIGPLGHGAVPTGIDAALLCVPDAQIAAAAELIPADIPVGHCSGATGLDVLGGRVAFSMHPLMTVTTESGGGTFAGAGAAVAGSTPRALEIARALAQRLEMRPIEIAPDDRAAYHAAASIASNFLVTIEAAAERVAATAGVAREDLVPLVRATVDNWAASGATRALTGPVARGDELTVARQRQAVAERAPELLALFDALVETTRMLADAARSERSDRPIAGATVR